MKSFDLQTYYFDLPQELIAQFPVSPRDSSRLLVVNRSTQSIEHRHFVDLPEYLHSGDLLVANNTQVIQARLLGHRLLENNQKGGAIEFLMLENRGPHIWEGAFRASAKHKPGVVFEIPTPDQKGLRGKIIRGADESPSGTIWVEFDRDPLESGAGEIPLPHYIERSPEHSDLQNYQTIYAKNLGSAAAPTAGLHFSAPMLSQLNKKGVNWSELTLHVGLGTFRPVKTKDIRSHVMHEEQFEISPELTERIQMTHRKKNRVIAVGTTSVRALESAWSKKDNGLKSGKGRTGIFIYPGSEQFSQFNVVDGLITNFHLPSSTLLMLVCTLGGTELILRAYREAVERKYRFFSYGDAMLIV